MIRVWRLRKPRVGTWSSSEPDSFLPNLGLMGRPVRSIPATVAPNAAVIPVGSVLGWFNFMPDDESMAPASRGLDGKDSWPTYHFIFAIKKSKIRKDQPFCMDWNLKCWLFFLMNGNIGWLVIVVEWRDCPFMEWGWSLSCFNMTLPVNREDLGCCLD